MIYFTISLSCGNYRIQFNEQVIAPQEVDIPGWSEKNVQVQPQVIEVVSHIASTATRFPKKCVVLCIAGICERVADIKTRAQAMKCLTTFSESMGTGFIFERFDTEMLLDVQDNERAQKPKGSYLVSSAAATTIITTIKLIDVLHKLVGSDIKAFLSDVMPAILSVVEAECEKNPFEDAAAAPKKIVMASDSVSSVFGGVLDSLPREDNSRKITPELLKGLECSDWKVNEHCTISHIVDYAQMRLESIEAVNKIVEEANKRIQPTGTVELFGALRARLYDSNQNLIMATLTSISGLESAMGPAIEKSSKVRWIFLSTLIVDMLAHGEMYRGTFDFGSASTDLDKVQYITPSMNPSMTDDKLGADMEARPF
ncbi:protein MOR1 [Tanacetum coccineum]